MKSETIECVWYRIKNNFHPANLTSLLSLQWKLNQSFRIESSNIKLNDYENYKSRTRYSVVTIKEQLISWMKKFLQYKELNGLFYRLMTTETQKIWENIRIIFFLLWHSSSWPMSCLLSCCHVSHWHNVILTLNLCQLSIGLAWILPQLNLLKWKCFEDFCYKIEQESSCFW